MLLKVARVEEKTTGINMKYFKRLLAFTSFFSIVFTAQAKDYDTIQLQSEVLDEQRQYSVSLPKDYATTGQHYPVIYRLDGAQNIPLMEAVLGRLQENDAAPQVIIVAIENTDRLRDMYPTVNEDPNGPVGLGGGADKFLSFIENELIPMLKSAIAPIRRESLPAPLQQERLVYMQCKNALRCLMHILLTALQFGGIQAPWLKEPSSGFLLIPPRIHICT